MPYISTRWLCCFFREQHLVQNLNISFNWIKLNWQELNIKKQLEQNEGICQTFSFMSIYFEESPDISEAYIYWIFLSDHGTEVLYETSDILLTTILPFPLPVNLTNAMNKMREFFKPLVLWVFILKRVLTFQRHIFTEFSYQTMELKYFMRLLTFF
jgi:hypothetical protein